MRFDGGLYFVTTEVLSDRLRDHTVAAEPPVEHVVLDFEAVNFVDSQGAGELGRLVQIAGERGVSVHFARMKVPVRDLLAADGIVERLGEDHFHVSVDDAVNAALAQQRRQR